MASGSVRADLLDLDATGRRAHEQDPPSGPIEDGAQVDLPDDVGGRRDEHRLDGDALDVHAQDLPGDRLRLGRAAGDLDAASLATAADEDLSLDHDPIGTLAELGLGQRPRLIRRACHAVGWHRQAGRREERLGVVLLQLHGRSRAPAGDGMGSVRIARHPLPDADHRSPLGG